MFASTAAFLCAGKMVSAATDTNYNDLFTDSVAAVDVCLPATEGTIPPLKGFWLITSAGKFSMGKRKFVANFDVFGKMHRFDFSKEPGKVCYLAKMMPTQFYKKSMKRNTIDDGILFHETDPPRSKCLDPLCNLLAPNDNTFVNTLRPTPDAKTFCSVTDSATWQDFDPETLDSFKKHSWKDHTSKKGYIGALGPAHPKQRPGKLDEWVSLVQEVPARNTSGPPVVNVVSFSGSTSFHERTLQATYSPPFLPYFHSFGITSDFIVNIHQPVTVNFSTVEKTGILGDSFVDLTKSGTTNQFYIIPLSPAPGVAASPIEVYDSTEKFFHLHTVNTYVDTDSTVVIDVESYDHFLYTDPTLYTSGVTNKTVRDAAWTPRGIKRYRIDRKLKTAKLDKTLSMDRTFTTFPLMHPGYSGRKYCFYYAVEMFHNHVEFASFAIVKQNVCTGERTYWFEEGHFQSEATFVPTDPSLKPDEDSGSLIFVDYDGKTRNSTLVTVDAKTMKTTAKVSLPERVPFTLHGEWYS